MPYLPCLNTKAIACIWCVVSSFNSDKNKARSRASSKTLKFCCLWFLIKQALRSWQMWLFLSFLSSVIYNVKNYIHTHTHTHTHTHRFVVHNIWMHCCCGSLDNIILLQNYAIFFAFFFLDGKTRSIKQKWILIILYHGFVHIKRE